MSDGESTTPAPRRRPSYGLPGPTSPAPGYGAAPDSVPDAASGTGATPDPGYSAPGRSDFGEPSPHASGLYGQDSHGQNSHSHDSYGHNAYGHDSYTPRTGPLPATGGPATAPAPRRRRGLLPLIIGLVLLLVIGPAATIGGIIWSLGSLAADASTGPVALEGATSEVEVSANEMLIVYVPQEDAAEAQCTAEGTDPGAVSTVPSSTSTTFGDGSQYVQVLGVAALDDTTVTISCTGTESPAFLGPYSLLKMAGPLLIGPLIGLIAGLSGLVLTIIGIVLLVRSRRV